MCLFAHALLLAATEAALLDEETLDGDPVYPAPLLCVTVLGGLMLCWMLASPAQQPPPTLWWLLLAAHAGRAALLHALQTAGFGTGFGPNFSFAGRRTDINPTSLHYTYSVPCVL